MSGFELHLLRPQWLWLIIPALVVCLLLWRQRGRSGSWRSVIDPDLLPLLVSEQATGRTRNLLPWLLLAWLVTILAAAGPSWQKLPQPVHQSQDAMVLVLDLSYSMKSADLAPSRIDRARQKLLDLLEQRSEGQTGLIAYAGDSHVVTPLTDDNPTIANLLPALHPDMMPLPGSEPVAALEQAVELLRSAGQATGKILLVTDGIETDQVNRLAETLPAGGITLTIIGVGTASGAPIPLARGGFLKDRNGTIVMPALKEQPLRQLASQTGGRYIPISVDGSDLERVLSASLLPGEQATIELERTADTWEDAGYWLILLLLPGILPLFRRGWLLSITALLVLVQPDTAQAQVWDKLWYTPDQQGQRALQQGDAEKAATLFDNRDWAGTAAYESGDYESSVNHFSQNDSADGWYNRANALARAEKYDEAIAAYNQSLALRPDSPDALGNRDLVEQLKEQQQQQQQQPGENSQDQDQDQQQQDQDQQGDGSQSDGEQGEQNPDNSEQGQSDPQQDEQKADGEQEPQPAQAQPGQDEEAAPQAQPGEEKLQAAAEQASELTPEEQEKMQAMEQWLRRVPDDPSGLLKEKFRYESLQRQQRDGRRENDKVW
jgi:Ca-activated chloride channel homolog